MASVTAAAVANEIDRAFPDRKGMSLVPDHRAKIEGILDMLEQTADTEFMVLPDVALERLARAVDSLRSCVSAWGAAGERERRLLAQPAFDVEPLEELRAACASASQATRRHRELANGLARLLADFDELPGHQDAGRQAYFLRWSDRASAWLRKEIGTAEADDFSSTVLISGAGREDAAVAHLKALRNEIAKDPARYENVAKGPSPPDAAPAGRPQRLNLRQRDALREAVLLRAYDEFGPDGSGSVEDIAVEESSKRGGNRDDAIEAILYWNQRGFLRNLTHNGTARLSPRGVDFVEAQRRGVPDSDAADSPERPSSGVRVRLALLVFVLGLLVGVYVERNGLVNALALAFLSSTVQFVVASAVAGLGIEVAGGRLNKHGVGCLRMPSFWLAMASLFLGFMWLARLALPAGQASPHSTINTPAVSPAHTPSSRTTE